MNNQQIIRLIQESATLLKQEYSGSQLKEVDIISRSYAPGEFNEFKRDLTEAGNRIRIIYLEHSVKHDQFKGLVESIEIPVVCFLKTKNGIIPVLLHKTKRNQIVGLEIMEDGCKDTTLNELNVSKLVTNDNDEVLFLAVFSYKSLVSDDPDDEEEAKPYNPVQRLIRLLSEEKKDILYIYVYALFVGIIGLTLPLGIQATVELISGGVVFSSVYLLIALVIVGILATGALQVMQIQLVEYVQRRVFTKAAFEFAFRVPRIKLEALNKIHAPELINRFFDVLTIQKGLPKMLIDLSSGIIQILFGLLLLSFYHPFFVFFGLILVTTLVLIFYFTGPKGMRSSIKESKYKYRVVYWLEEMARALNSFKLSGNSTLPIKRTDYNVNSYLLNRKTHFRVLVNQFSWVLVFKAAVTGGLLIIGTALVINREITLGQFVAAEVIIILILNSVEKIITYMDVVYDMLTAVDKIAQVTDLPLEKSGGIDIPRFMLDKGYAIRIKDLTYKYPGEPRPTLRNIDLEIKSGEKVCISGAGGSGKTTLTQVISGLHMSFEGIVTINDFSIRDLDLTNLRDKIGVNVSQEDLFDGTILENILVGKPLIHQEDAIWAINEVGIADQINSLPDGLNTHIISGGKGLSKAFVNKLILARLLAKRPNLIILNDFFNVFQKSDRLKLISILVREDRPWTLIAVSNDPMIMSACDRVLLLEHGELVGDAPCEDLLETDLMRDIAVK